MEIRQILLGYSVFIVFTTMYAFHELFNPKVFEDIKAEHIRWLYEKGIICMDSDMNKLTSAVLVIIAILVGIFWPIYIAVCLFTMIRAKIIRFRTKRLYKKLMKEMDKNMEDLEAFKNSAIKYCNQLIEDLENKS